MLQRLFPMVLTAGLALAGLALVPSLPQDLQTGSWPAGTQFALVDQDGRVVWQPGASLDPGLLQRAVALRITLPDGRSYLVSVTVEGKGAGLGEVKLSVNGRNVPLPEPLHAKGFTLKDGKIVKEKPGKDEDASLGPPDEKEDHPANEDREAHEAHEDHPGKGGYGKGHRP